MNKVFTFFAVGILCLLTTTGQAQFSNNFDTNGSYASNCWNFEGFFQTTSPSEVINGTASLYTNPPTNNNGSGTRDINTPYLDIPATNFSVSFNYKLNSTLNGQAVRNIEVGLKDKNGVFTSLDIITMKGNTPNITLTNQYSKTFNLGTASVQRLVLKFSGSLGDGNTRMIVDDLLVSANAHYNGSTNCNSAPLAADNNYTAPSLTEPYIGSSVLNNDSDPNGETLSASLASQSIDGTVVMNPDGTFTFTPNPGFTGSFTTFTYKVTDNGYDPMTTTATVYIYFSQVSTLSIQLLRFSGSVGAKANLAWHVTANENGQFFEVQRSNTNGSFQTIATVFTSDKRGDEQYQFADALPTKSTSYRLKVVKKDGTMFYSTMVMFKAAADAGTITLLQNPVQTNLRFLVPSTEIIKCITIYNTSGAAIYTEKPEIQSYKVPFNIFVTNLRPGTYVLQVTTRDCNKTTMFIKK